MPPLIDVHSLPDHVLPEMLQGGVAVVVDILRASTTILTALDNGAEAVRPCLTIDEALACRDEDKHVLLGGERGGIRIEGFDLSNSPTDFTQEAVGGRMIAFTTTNGTRALHHSAQADEILIGAFANVTGLAGYLAETDRPVHIVCAGTNGDVTGEDVLFAGALVNEMLHADRDAGLFDLSDAAKIASDYWQRHCGSDPDLQLQPAIMNSRGGRNLVQLGYEKDIATAAAINSVPMLGIVGSDLTIRTATSQ